MTKAELGKRNRAIMKARGLAEPLTPNNRPLQDTFATNKHPKASDQRPRVTDR